VIAGGADCIIYVGNAIEGAVFSKALAAFPEADRLPIISHWGLTGGNFHELYKNELYGSLDLSFLQTCFSFNSGELTGKGAEVFQTAQKLFSNKISSPEDIQAPPGFIHAYDIGQVIIAALKQIKITGDIKTDRSNLRLALENIQQPVEGLIKKYAPPFSTWQQSNVDAHEALDLGDFCMAAYDENGIIKLK
jgi:branched-chain amino acid transport system substrate-binding protein